MIVAMQKGIARGIFFSPTRQALEVPDCGSSGTEQGAGASGDL